ncbi:O-antigen ligase family protein [Shewanella aestuarii]|uniref:O-antigen ligase family protein n=1 Tax=Shewanella aestuarii TaxID=1028752 RepID=A0A6G9QM15_9GAMM|nr:O-antigen ligase family protein [Shewanella aestuarii]QIR15105.1 hypothetical protein HBH39_11940 [Shewanella aestuarii]
MALVDHNGKMISRGVYLHKLAMWMMALYLLADMASGFSVIYIGMDLKISLLYKMPLFILLMILIARFNLGSSLFILATLLFFLLGPLVIFFKKVNVGHLFLDFGYAVKIMMPAVVMTYFFHLYQRAPNLAFHFGKKIMQFSFLILSFNFILAASGVGKATYQLVEDDTAGSTGLIYAGNELGPAFLLVFGYVLHHVWNGNSRIQYLLLSLFTLLCGVTVATKTTMLASILLVFFIPIMNERKHLFNLTWLKLKLFLPLIVFCVGLVIVIADLLETLGLYDRIMWFYEQKGLIGVIWSGRNEFIAQMFVIFKEQTTLFHQVFGQGFFIETLHPRGKGAVEVDVVDTIIYFGFFGALVTSLFYLLTFYFALKKVREINTYLIPCIVLVDFLLLILSVMSGHIWMSGTVGILFGVFNSFLFYEYAVGKNGSTEAQRSYR